MAPRRGGGGGGGFGGGSGSSSSCDSDYPCTIELSVMYGFSLHGIYADDEIYGQIILFCLWTIALIVLFILSVVRTKRSGQQQSITSKVIWSLQLSMVLFSISFVLLCARYGIIRSGSNVPIEYRFVSSVVVFLQRAGVVFLFLGVGYLLLLQRQFSGAQTYERSQRRALFVKLGIGFVWLAYAALNATYVVIDFIVSSHALEAFKDSDGSRNFALGDRDFAVTMDASMIHHLIYQSRGSEGYNPESIILSMMGPMVANNYTHIRDLQIKIGVAADSLAFVLACMLLGLVIVTQRHFAVKSKSLCLIAVAGLLLCTLFRLVVVSTYVVNNWNVITDARTWSHWLNLYPDRDSVFDPIIPPDGFLEGYRITADGFPVIQALFEPFGVVLAIGAVMLAGSAEERTHETAGPAPALEEAFKS